MTTWSVPFSRLAAKMRQDVNTTAQQFTFNLFKAVIDKSPVLTGRFKSNWNVSYGQADMSVTESTTTAKTQLELLKVFRLPAGGIVYLSNGLPYAVNLEYGWSQKAPAGMIRVSVAEANAHMRRALRS